MFLSVCLLTSAFFFFLCNYCHFYLLSVGPICVFHACLLFDLIKSDDNKKCVTLFFHRRTRAYVYNHGCLVWYNVVLTHGSTQA